MPFDNFLALEYIKFHMVRVLSEAKRVASHMRSLGGYQLCFGYSPVVFEKLFYIKPVNRFASLIKKDRFHDF